MTLKYSLTKNNIKFVSVKGMNYNGMLFSAIESLNLSGIEAALKQEAKLYEKLEVEYFNYEDPMRSWAGIKKFKVTPADLLIFSQAPIAFIESLMDKLPDIERKALWLKQITGAAIKDWRDNEVNFIFKTKNDNAQEIAHWAFEKLMSMSRQQKIAGKSVDAFDFSPFIYEVQNVAFLKKMAWHPDYTFHRHDSYNFFNAAYNKTSNKTPDEVLIDHLFRHYGSDFDKETLIARVSHHKVFEALPLLDQALDAYDVLAGKSEQVMKKLEDFRENQKKLENLYQIEKKALEQEELRRQQDSLAPERSRHEVEPFDRARRKMLQEEIERLEKLVDPKNTDWIHHASRPFGWTPLAAALDQKKWDLTLKLLEFNASHEASIKWYPETEPLPLITVMAIKGHKDAVQWLLQKGVPVEALRERFKHPEFGWVTPLIVAALKGHEEMVDFLLKTGAPSNVFTGSQLKKIGNEYPHLRQKLGEETFMESFSRQIKKIGLKLAGDKKEETINGSKEALGGAEEAVTNTLDVLSENSVLSVTSLDRVRKLIHALNLPEETQKLCLGEITKAEKLTSLGSLPVQGDDLMALQRMWNVNVPLLINKLSAIPSEHREQIVEAGLPSPLQMFTQSFRAISETLKLMQERALIKANRRLVIEAAVLHDQAKLALDRFAEVIDSADHKAQQNIEVNPTNSQSRPH